MGCMHGILACMHGCAQLGANWRGLARTRWVGCLCGCVCVCGRGGGGGGGREANISFSPGIINCHYNPVIKCSK